MEPKKIMLMKESKVRKLNLDPNRRMIFVSDIHGDYNSFKNGLDRLGFNNEDYLFIIGDIYEKGDESYNLKTLEYVMELSKLDNVYPMAGNCDEVFRFILADKSDEKFLYYVVDKKHSILNDIAKVEGIEINRDMDIKAFKKMLTEKYSKFYDFMDSLDDLIIINDKIVLVHAGVDDIDDIPKYSISMLKYDRFYELSKRQEKIMIVGHYPTRNYRADLSCVNPIFDFKKNIISIDGGNHLVKGGQLNFIVLDSLDSMKFSYIYEDHYEKYMVLDDIYYKEPENPVSLTYGNNEVEVLDTDLDFDLVRDLKTNTTMWVHSSFVYHDKKTNKTYAYDASNNFLSLRYGDFISIIKRANPYSVIKKNGYIGLVETKYLI